MSAIDLVRDQEEQERELLGELATRRGVPGPARLGRLA